MNIAFVHTQMIGAEGVGSTHSASRLVRELANAGHKVTVYCPKYGENTVSEKQITNNRISVTVLDTTGGLPVVPQRIFADVGEGLVERASEFEKFDILHSYVSAIPWLAEIRSRISTPVITTLNGYGPVCPKSDLFYKDSEPCRQNGKTRCSKCVLKSTIYPENSDLFDGASVFDEYGGIKRVPATGYLLMKRFQNLRTILDIQNTVEQLDMYHVQADHLKEIFVSFGFPENRFYTVPNVLDERFLTPHKRSFKQPFQLLYVGSLIKKKGVQKLLPMLEYLNSNYDSKFELTIVGDGYLKSSLEQEARKKGLNANFTGRIPYRDLPNVYSSHDIFVYPGIWEEPFARVFLEALATGTPIVGSSVGDFGQIVGEAGIATDGSVEALGDGVYKLSKRQLDELSDKARDEANKYRPESVIPQLEEMYGTVVSHANQ